MSFCLDPPEIIGSKINENKKRQIITVHYSRPIKVDEAHVSVWSWCLFVCLFGFCSFIFRNEFLTRGGEIRFSPISEWLIHRACHME